MWFTVTLNNNIVMGNKKNQKNPNTNHEKYHKKQVDILISKN